MSELTEKAVSMQQIVNEYAEHRNKYIIQCSKRLFLEKIAENLKEGKELNLDKENAEIKTTVDAQFNKSRERYLETCSKLKALKEQDQNTQNLISELDGKIEMLKKIHSEKNNDDGVYKKVDDDIDVKMHVGMSKKEQKVEAEKQKAILARLEEELNKKQEELVVRQKNEAEVKNRVDALQSADTNVNEVSDDDINAIKKQIKDKDDKLVSYKALIAALEKFTGLKILEVIESTTSLQLFLQIGDACEAVLYLQKGSFRLCGIKVTSSGAPIDVNKLLIRASKFKAPHDLKFAIFSLGAQQSSQQQFSTDLFDLKKKVLVRQISNYSAQITLPNGILVEFDVDDCYPLIPNGVQLTSITAEGWNEEKKSILTEKMNNKDAFNGTVVSFYDHLLKEMSGMEE